MTNLNSATPSLSFPVVVIEFTEQIFPVSENNGSVTVCLQTSSGHDGNITITVNSYEKDVDNSASEFCSSELEYNISHNFMDQ